MTSNNGVNLGFEQKMWQAADKLRGNMDAAEYKHVVLGVIFLKYISDAFEEHQKELEEEASNPKSEWYVKEPSERYYIKEEKEAYTKDNVFWVPEKARWKRIEQNAKSSESLRASGPCLRNLSLGLFCSGRSLIFIITRGNCGLIIFL